MFRTPAAGALTLLTDTRPLRAAPLSSGSWWQDVDTQRGLRVLKLLLRALDVVRLADVESGIVAVER